VAPTNLSLQGPGNGLRGQNLSYTVNFTDAGANDTHRVRWEFGDGSIFEADVVGHSATMSHAFGAAGNFNVRVTILDNAGGSSAAQLAVAVTEQQQQEQRYQFVNDPMNPGKKMLIVNGTAGNDVIRLKGKKNQGVAL